jgi:methyl-accepting chemotaxis sensory transducer
LLNNVQTALNEFGSKRDELMEKFEAGLMSKEEFISYFQKAEKFIIYQIIPTVQYMP